MGRQIYSLLLLTAQPPVHANAGSSGAGEGIRTPDPLITNQMLYQLSYASRRKLLIIGMRF